MNPNDPYAQLPPQPQQPPLQPSAPPYGPTIAQPSAQTTSGSNPYDFIISAPPKPKKSVTGATKLLILVVGIGLVVVIGGFIVAALAPSSGSKTTLTSLAQEQQEIIRVAQAAESLASDQSAKNLVYSIDLSIGTSQAQLLAYMNTNNMKINDKALSAQTDTKTDQVLQAAQSTGTYDSTVKKVLAEQLTTYLTTLQQAYKESSNTALKQILDKSYTGGKILLVESQRA